MHMVRDLVHECVCNAFITLYSDELRQLEEHKEEGPIDLNKMKSINLVSFYLKELYKKE